MTDKANIEFVQQNVRFSVRYNFIIFPINFMMLQKILTLQKYTVTKPPQELQGVGNIFLDGPIASKDDISVDTQLDKQILGISSNDIGKLLSSFEDLEKGISTELGEDISSKVYFYETIMQFAVKTGKNPLKIMANLKSKALFCEAISKVFQQDVAPFGFRFSPAGIPVDSQDWFEFKIEPLISKATNAYFINIVLRNKEKTKVIDIIKKSKEIIISTLEDLESY